MSENTETKQTEERKPHLVKNQYKVKGNSGKHVASTTPYNYLKDSEDGNH